MRYTARGAVSLEWLAEDANGDLIYAFHRPWSDGTTGITLSPLELLDKLSAFVPLPTCPPRPLCGVSGATQHVSRCDHPHTAPQGVDGEETKTGTPYWHWARLLGRVFDLALATCPVCRRGSLRIIAAITQESVIRRILRHLKLASFHLPLHLPVVAKRYSLSTKPTTRGVISSAT